MARGGSRLRGPRARHTSMFRVVHFNTNKIGISEFLYTIFFSRSPYFRRFRCWPSAAKITWPRNPRIGVKEKRNFPSLYIRRLTKPYGLHAFLFKLMVQYNFQHRTTYLLKKKGCLSCLQPNHIYHIDYYYSISSCILQQNSISHSMSGESCGYDFCGRHSTLLNDIHVPRKIKVTKFSRLRK